jgi:peptidoglycan pentaglycine glycine transferase (the first glycine)
MMALLSASQWEQFLAGYPDGHLLQTADWGELKAAVGWQPVRVSVGESGAQLLFRPLGLGFSLAYLPKGPLGADWRRLWPEVIGVCQARRAVMLTVEPDAWDDEVGALAGQLPGFRPDGRPVQPRRTVVIDLRGSEEAWLARMKQKTRYNVRLAERKEVVVQPSQDLAEFYRLMQSTGARDGFGVHSQAYFERAYRLYQPSGAAELLVARYRGQALAALMVFRHGKRAWYLYGASTDLERNRMPAYLVQMEAMRWAATRGCESYDLWGIPDEDEATLEAQFEQRSDGLWGVYRFKRGFGGQIRRAAPAYELDLIPPLAWPLRWALKRRGGGD